MITAHPRGAQDLAAQIDTIRYRIERYARDQRKPIRLAGHRHVGGVLTFLAHKLPPSVTIADVRRMAENLAMAAEVGYVRVTQARNGAVLMEMPAPGARFFRLDDSDTLQGGARVSLGPLVSMQGDAVLDLDDPNSAHVLVAAITGGGKTTIEHALIYQLARQNTPDEVLFVILDPKAAISLALEHSAHLLHPIIRADRPQTLQAMYWLAGEVTRRARLSINKPRIVIIIDEMVGLVKSAAFKETLAEIVTKGRSLRVHVIAGTQYVSNEVLGLSLIRENFTARFAGRTMSAQASNYATGVAGFECHLLHGSGDFIAIPSGCRFQCAFVTDDALRRLPAHAQSRDALAITPPADVPASQVVLQAGARWGDASPAVDETDDLADRIAALKAQHPGARDSAIAAMLPGWENKAYGGDVWRKYQRALKRLKERSSSSAGSPRSESSQYGGEMPEEAAEVRAGIRSGS